jgi:putative transposase
LFSGLAVWTFLLDIVTPRLSCPDDNNNQGVTTMSRFRKLSQTIWHCQYHITWTPKYRYRILEGQIGIEVENYIRSFSDQQKCEIVELNIQGDHVHLIVIVPPKIAISDYLGVIKGRSAIRILNSHKKLRQKPYWGNHFWSKGYCVDTVGLNSEMIRNYVKYQEKQERRAEQLNMF